MENKNVNVGKMNYSLFHKPSRVDDLPLQLPKLSISDNWQKHWIFSVFIILWIKVDIFYLLLQNCIVYGNMER